MALARCKAVFFHRFIDSADLAGLEAWLNNWVAVGVYNKKLFEIDVEVSG